MIVADSVLADWPDIDNRVPSAIYTSDDVATLEEQRLFRGPVWHLMGHESEIPNPGDYKTMHLGTTPLIVIRDGDEVRVLVNSCAHRGAEVLRRPTGNVREGLGLTCIYHQWKYSNDGSVLSVARRNDYPADFDPKCHGLVRARVATHRGVIFVSLSPDTPPLEEYLGLEMLASLDTIVGDEPLRYLGCQRVVLQCNWKLYVENIYDSYHAYALHKGLRYLRVSQIDDDLTREHERRAGHFTTTIAGAPPDQKVLEDMDLFEFKSRPDIRNHIVNVFPAGPMFLQVDVLGIRCVTPRGPSETIVTVHTYGKASDSGDIQAQRVWQSANFLGVAGMVSLEDGAALARMQDGLNGKDRLPTELDEDRYPTYRPDEHMQGFYAAYRRLLG